MIAAITIAGCATVEPAGGLPVPLVDSTGQVIGSVRAWQTPGAVSFRILASGLPHGLHAIHVHATGRCDPPGFESAGGHWNPLARKHGLANPQGPHAGDLPNIEVASNGVLAQTVTLPGASLTGTAPFGVLLDSDGASLVIHADPDDEVTDPSGNSGARIACAVIRPVPELR